MNFVADESCAMPVVQELRKAGHDVIAISETAQGATDDEVLQLSVNKRRVLITEDRDFGELVYARGRSSAGVILVRFPGATHNLKANTMIEAVSRLALRLQNAFTVSEPGRVRISKRP